MFPSEAPDNERSSSRETFREYWDLASDDWGLVGGVSQTFNTCNSVYVAS
jgi:hypothetical protein